MRKLSIQQYPRLTFCVLLWNILNLLVFSCCNCHAFVAAPKTTTSIFGTSTLGGKQQQRLPSTQKTEQQQQQQQTRFSPILGSRMTAATTITTSTTTSTSLFCICIDCKWVTSCKAYHFVESKHEQPHISENPTFEPRDGSPTIHVNIRTIRTEKDLEAEMQRMWSEHAAETMLAEAAAAAAAAEAAEQGGDDSGAASDIDISKNVELHGQKVYDLSPLTTYEYDVVKCADFVEDKGCWVRNMPEEIKKANPQFVPS